MTYIGHLCNNITCCTGIFCLLLISSTAVGQNRKEISIPDKNSISYEFLGHIRSLLSVNYERICTLKPGVAHLALRTGIGFSPGITVKDVRHKGTKTIPLVTSLLLGKNRHFAQFGLSYSASFQEDFIDSTTTTPTIHQQFENTYGISAGYRYMWDNFVFQLYPIAQWTDNPGKKFHISIGISLGATF